MAIVYQHIRLDTNEVFYVGMGSAKNRAKSKAGRNKYWHNIVNKAGYKVEIIYNDLTVALAESMEIYLIAAYGRKDLGLGLLVNSTNGGKYHSGFKHNNVTKEKISNTLTGRKMSKESIQKSIDTKKENGYVVSDKTREKIGLASLGRVASKETKMKMSKARIGKASPLKGRTLSEEHKVKIADVNNIKVIDTITGKIFNSKKEAAKFLDIDYSTLLYQMKHGIRTNLKSL